MIECFSELRLLVSSGLVVMIFSSQVSDANCLAKSISQSESLTTLILQSNLIDDDLLRMLMTGLIKVAIDS